MTDPAALSLAEDLENNAYQPDLADVQAAAAMLRSLQAELEDERQASQESYDERMAEIESLQAENERLTKRADEGWFYANKYSDELDEAVEVEELLRERLAATEAVAHAAWHAMDNAEECADDEMRSAVEREDTERLCAALDALEAAGWEHGAGWVRDRLNEPSPE